MAPAPDRRSAVSDRDLLEELRRASTDLRQSLAGTNAHTDLRRAVENYEAALLEEPISISRLYGRGVRLENASRSVRSRIEAGDLPPFTAETEQDLDSVLDLHATYIMSEEDGRRHVEGAAAYRRTPVETAALREAAEQISSAVAQRPDVFSEEVRTHVAEVTQDVGDGPHPERSNQVAVTSFGNMTGGLLKWAGVVGASAIVGGRRCGERARGRGDRGRRKRDHRDSFLPDDKRTAAAHARRSGGNRSFLADADCASSR